eukprot:736020_1
MASLAPLSTDDSKEIEQIHTTNNQTPLSPFEWNRRYMSCKQGCWCPLPILHPLGGFKICWDFFVTICVIISWIEIPFTWAFDIDIEYHTRIGIIIFLVYAVFILDLR